MSTKTPSLSAPMTLDDVIQAVLARDELPRQRRQDLASAVRRVAHLCSRPPGDIPAEVEGIRRQLALFTPAGAGMTPRRWKNVRSLMAAALQIAGVTVVRRRRRDSLSPVWGVLFKQVADRYERARLSRLASFCTANDILPGEISDIVLDRFGARLLESSLVERPTQVHRETWTVVEVFTDHAISGATTLRPGYQAVLAALRAGGIDVVLAESLDRFSRDQEHIAGFYKQAVFAGTHIVTLAEGDISELHIGLKGTMGAMYLRDLAQKTRRGLEGRVRAGRAVGTTPYGYALVRRLDDGGALERGLRQIDPSEAAIVWRIFRDYAAGQSPLAISTALNVGGVPGPSGAIWYDATIRGRPGRGDGILRNQIYIGRQIWNRRHRVQDPVNGTQHRRVNDPNDIVVQEVPALRIIDRELWDRVQARLMAEQARRPANSRAVAGWNFWERRRPRHLLTGKVVCGSCGALFKTLGQDYLGCRAASQGSCLNTCRVRRGKLEAHVLDVLGRQLMDPDLVREFVDAFTVEWNRLIAEPVGSARGRDSELRATERKIANLLDAISDGMRSVELKQRLADLEARKGVLLAERNRTAEPLPALHPNIADVYRRKVASLREALNAADNTEALEAARQLIDQIVISPPKNDGDPPEIEVIGEFVAMLGASGVGGANTANLSPNNNVLRAFVSSVKVAQGALLPGGGSGAKPPLLPP